MASRVLNGYPVSMTYEAMIPRELSALVERELDPGERVVWTGLPLPGRFARRAWGMVIFGIPWTAFALFWIAGASGGAGL